MLLMKPTSEPRPWRSCGENREELDHRHFKVLGPLPCSDQALDGFYRGSTVEVRSVLQTSDKGVKRLFSFFLQAMRPGPHTPQ